MASVSFALPRYNKEWEESVEVRGEAPASPMRHTPVDNHELVYDMSPAHKNVLKRNHVLLVHNIIMTSEFAEKLRHYHILADSMVDDIMSCSSREEQNELLLKLLPLRGVKAFERFCDALHASGHWMLADILHADDNNGSSEMSLGVEMKDVYHQFPQLDRILTESFKRKLEAILNQVIKTQVATFIRHVEARLDKEKESSQFQKALEREKKNTEEIEEGLQNIETLKGKHGDLMKQIQEKDNEVKGLQEEIQLKEQEYLRKLNLQNRMNEAESRCLIKMDRVVQDNKMIINSLCAKLKDYMRDEYLFGVKEDSAYLMENFMSFLAKHDSLNTKHDQLLYEYQSIFRRFEMRYAALKSMIVHGKGNADMLKLEISSMEEDIRQYRNGMKAIFKLNPLSDRRTSILRRASSTSARRLTSTRTHQGSISLHDKCKSANSTKKSEDLLIKYEHDKKDALHKQQPVLHTRPQHIPPHSSQSVKQYSNMHPKYPLSETSKKLSNVTLHLQSSFEKAQRVSKSGPAKLPNKLKMQKSLAAIRDFNKNMEERRKSTTLSMTTVGDTGELPLSKPDFHD